jgi:hypothetical protein
MPRFNLAGYVKEKKRLRQEIVMNNRGITELEDELSVVTLKKTKQNKGTVQSKSEMPKA